MKFRDFLYKYKKGLCLGLVGLMGLSMVGGVTMNVVNQSKTQTNTAIQPVTKVDKETDTTTTDTTTTETTTTETTKTSTYEPKLLESKQVLNVDMLVKDISEYLKYDFEEIIEENIKIYKHKDSNLVLYTTTDKEIFKPEVLSNQVVLTKEEFQNYNILDMEGLKFFSDNQIGVSEEVLLADFNSIKESEKINPSTSDTEDKNYYNFSYNIGFSSQNKGYDNYLSIFVISEGDKVTIQMEVLDVNPSGIDFQREWNNVHEVALLNNYLPTVNKTSTIYQKRFSKDFLKFTDDKENDLFSFSLQTTDALTERNYLNKVEYMTKFLFDALNIVDEKEQKYVKENVDNLITSILKNKGNGMTTLPIELFYWKFDVLVTVTNEGFSIDFVNIDCLDEFPEINMSQNSSKTDTNNVENTTENTTENTKNTETTK